MTAADIGLEVAEDADVPAVVALMNLAYRGKGEDAGWSVEADYIDGDRTSETLLRQDIAADPHAKLLLWRGREADGLIGCVWLRPEGEGRWYLGSLAVDPRRQAAGLGRRLLAAAEAWVLGAGGREIRMTVIHVRDTLIAWYARRGYGLTGETEPFPYGDDRFGVPRRDDLRFVVLRKRLAPL